MGRIGTFLATVVIAAAAGYLAGIAGTSRRVQAAPIDVIRASRFELIDEKGNTRSTWIAEGNEAHIRFLPGHGRPPIDIGVLSDGSPFLGLAGRDGKQRIVMGLDQQDKPVLSMSDEKWEGRVLLGFVAPDTYTPEWDNWGLLFRAFGSERPVASMGVLKDNRGASEGVITLSGKRIR